MDEKTFNHCLKNIRKKEYFDELYTFFYKRIVVHIFRNFGDSMFCEDVAQECFVTLLNLKEYKHIKHYTSWLFKIADNIALRKYGKEATQKNRSLYLDVVSFDKYNIEPFGAYQRIIDKEDDTSKSLMYLYYVEGYSLAEIAEILNIRYENARQIHHRCIKKIKIAQKSEKIEKI